MHKKQLFKFTLWYKRLGVWGWIYRPLQRPQWKHHLEHQLSDGRAGAVGIYPQSPVNADGFCKLRLVLRSNFHKAMGEETLRCCPSVLGSQGCWGNHALSWKQCSWNVVSQSLSTCMHFLLLLVFGIFTSASLMHKIFPWKCSKLLLFSNQINSLKWWPETFFTLFWYSHYVWKNFPAIYHQGTATCTILMEFRIWLFSLCKGGKREGSCAFNVVYNGWTELVRWRLIALQLKQFSAQMGYQGWTLVTRLISFPTRLPFPSTDFCSAIGPVTSR